MDKNKDFNYNELLKPDIMLRLYASGAFPMADETTGEINWFMPEIRTIIPIDNYNIPRSLKKIINANEFEIRFDFDFYSVVKACADRETTWISKELIQAYTRLKKLGHIHTVEIYQNKKLTGGLYGVSYAGAFFGESMFSLKPQASKIALAILLEHLKEKNFLLLDVQYMTPHLKMFGATEISFTEYNQLLYLAYGRKTEF
ncbi:MAG: leucyl/phenylalanyl-tRNA--protein transferase [Ignavibacteriaceae bacterium]|nr:leucyl/phenylalanyl-tRNA--protein transferase [Ignavibacteriaceae bacterium]